MSNRRLPAESSTQRKANHRVSIFQSGRDLDLREYEEPYDFEIRFQEPIVLNPKEAPSREAGERFLPRYEMQLSKITLYLDYPNVSDALQNRTLSYFNGAVQRVLEIEEGSYTAETLNDEIHEMMRAQGDYTIVDGEDRFEINVEIDGDRGSVELTVGAGYSLDLTQGNLYELLGANKQVYTSGEYEFINPNFLIYDQLYVMCDSVTDSYSYLNGLRRPILASITPLGAPQELIEVVSDVWVEMRGSKQIDTLNIQIVDEKGEFIPLREFPSLQISMRPQEYVWVNKSY